MILGIDISRLASIQKTGVEWYVYFLLRELRDIIPAGVEVRLYTLDTPIIDFDLPSNFVIHQLHWKPRCLWTQVRLSFEMFMRPPDILFVPSHVIPLVHPKRTVTTIHDIAAVRFPQAYNMFERWYSVYAARRSMTLPAVLTPSEFTKRELLEEIGGLADTITVTPLGFELTLDAAEIDLSTYGIRTPYILSVGRLEEKKNTRRIVDAFARLKQDPEYASYQLVLVGKPGHGYVAVEEAIAAAPCRSDICMPDWLPPTVLGSLYRESALFVFPSLYEGFGIPILEAFAAGTPVLTSRGTSTEEVAGDAALLIDPVSAESICMGMKLLLTNHALREKNIRQGRKRVSQYSWKQTARETWQAILDVYDRT
jgi:glycosyltransferase involved in cell wall biosynthesis